jgi:hypothetical protein
MNAVRVLAVVCGLAGSSKAEPRPHAIYGELFGKGGLWGAGYDYQPRRGLAAGLVGSYYVLGGDRYTTLAPYVAAYPFARGHHRWFVQVGPQLVRRHTPSPVPEWMGSSSTSWAGEASSGYEYRRGLLVRVYAMAAVGARFAPWLGASFGWTL